MPLVLIPDGPGTTIDLREGFQGLPVAPRGTGAIMGQYSSGPTTHAALALTPETARLVSGDPDDLFEASLNLDDLYSEDSPPTLIGRVTDGNDVQAQQDLWDRQPSRSMVHRVAGKQRDPFATAKANNGGRWGGRKRVVVGKVTDVATDLTVSTLDISNEFATLLQDVYKDAQLFLEGDVSNSPYIVDSNDTAGVLTIKGEFSQAAQDADGTGAIDGNFRIVLAPGKELSAVIGPDSVVGAEFALQGLRKFTDLSDWEVVTSYANLQLDVQDDRPWIPTISDGELRSYQLDVSTTYTGATVEEKLPCNFCEVPTDLTSNVLTFQWYRWYVDVTNTGDPYVTTVAPVDVDSIEQHTITLDFTAATVGTVTITWPDGTTQLLAATFTLGTVYTPDHPQLAVFRAIAGATPAVSGDQLTIRVDSLPGDLSSREAFVYPVAIKVDGNPSVRHRIVSNTYNTISIRSDLVFTDIGAVTAVGAQVTGTIDITSVTWAAASTLIFTDDAGSAVTFTSPGGGITGAQNIADELTSQDTANLFVFTIDSSGQLVVTLAKSFGTASRLRVGAGTANATIGFAGTEDENGIDGVPFRLEGRFPMWGGYDGVTPGDARYILALDLSDNIFVRWLQTNLGLVRIATPGITSTGVKQAVAALVAKHGWIGVAEFVSSLEDVSSPGEAAVSDMQANEAESDFMEHYFPSRAKFLNVKRTKLVTRSVTGLVMGIRSRLANLGIDGEKGFHIAAANNNPQGLLSPRVQGLPDGIGRWTPPIGLLNDHGITPLLWEGPDVYLYGNRLYSKGRTALGKRFTVTERAVFYHVSRDLFVTTRPFIFKSISQTRLAEVTRSLREKMKVYWSDGWLSDFNGPGFEQQTQIAVPPELNTPELLLEGMVSATIQFRPRPALEDLKIIISPTELTSEG